MSGKPRKTGDRRDGQTGQTERFQAGGAYVPTVFVGMYATQGRYNVRVSTLKHYYGLNHLHYLTTSIPQGGTARPCLTQSVLGSNGLLPSAGCGGN